MVWNMGVSFWNLKNKIKTDLFQITCFKKTQEHGGWKEPHGNNKRL